ncbi:hypothetical protein MRBLMN1_001759 [Chitinophaga ginsengisegetis]|uniref:hypothetical protein n=1 Tax=Chitinophaga ginsengisegetis TaxID=393003 RepID=UPI00344805D0
MKLVRLFLIFTLSGCAVRTNKIIGSYRSSCYINLYPNVILKIDSSHAFSYKLAYLDDKIEGSWIVRRDTLFLFSEWFNKKIIDPWEPIHKLTDQEGMDTYIIKKNGLYMLLREGINKDCFLKGQSTSK